MEEREAIKMAETISRGGTRFTQFGRVQYKRNPADSGLIRIIKLNPRTCRGIFLGQERASYGAIKVTRVIRKWIEVNKPFVYVKIIPSHYQESGTWCNQS